jgi:phospholipid/cholesterol/gamma-HCH transport system ATP-binding protein
VVVTHDLKSAFRVGDQVAMLYHGTIRQVDTVERIQRTHDPIVRQFIEGRPEAAAETDFAANGGGIGSPE